MIGAAKVGFLRDKAPPLTVYTIDMQYGFGLGGFELVADAAVPLDFKIGETLTVNGYSNFSCTTGTGQSRTISNFTLTSGSTDTTQAGTGTPPPDGMDASDFYQFSFDTTVLVSIDGGTATNRTSGVQWSEGGYGWIFNFNNDCNFNSL